MTVFNTKNLTAKVLIKANLLLVLFIAGNKTANAYYRPFVDTANMAVVTLFSNGYVYPDDENSRFGMIDESGLSKWRDATGYTRTFFLPQQTGQLQMALKVKSAVGNSRLHVSLDSSAKGYDVMVNQTAEYVIIPVGKFTIGSIRYHSVVIKGLSKTGNIFPAIEAVVLSGEAAKNVKFNTSEYRGAPATHLTYKIPGDSNVAWFYSEVLVPVGTNAVNAYYETNGFDGGYMGIQLNSPTERRIIFSIWSNYNTDDPKQIPADYAINLLKKGKDVFTGEFGNEGSGGHSHLVFNWKAGIIYKLLVGAKPAGDHTIYTAYYFAPENGDWKLIAQWDKTKTGGKLLSGLYSFVENFGSNGNDYFKATYGNQWVCMPSGNWLELTQATFTTTANKMKHPRFDYGAGVENNWFYMFSGGFKELNNVAPYTIINRKPNGVAPDINFATLPQQ